MALSALKSYVYYYFRIMVGGLSKEAGVESITVVDTFDLEKTLKLAAKR